MASEAARRRYWARSFAGWHEFSGVRHNGAHEALARLQARGWLSALITQNVDRLHHKAGATDVIELHGTTHRCWRHKAQCPPCQLITGFPVRHIFGAGDQLHPTHWLCWCRAQ